MGASASGLARTGLRMPECRLSECVAGKSSNSIEGEAGHSAEGIGGSGWAAAEASVHCLARRTNATLRKLLLHFL